MKYEKIPTIIYPSAREASIAVALEIKKLIEDRFKEGKKAVLGLATGSTPTRVYEELVRLHKEEGLSFQNVITFNLDEYYPIEPNSLQSYVRFMNEYLFDHIDIQKENIHIPDGTIKKEEINNFCGRYEKNIEDVGGIDIQLLGIGRTGHIGFNEPGSSNDSETRLITLDKITRTDAASDFFGEENVPRCALTMGVGSILKAKQIIMMAWGEAKSVIVKRTVEGVVSDSIPATYLQQHPNVRIILDDASSSELTRIKTPWLHQKCVWDDALTTKAIVWLCQAVNKPILKLTDEDYNEHGMSDLNAERGPVYNINIRIFNELQRTITGWPGGKPNADDTFRPERSKPFPKRVLIFSPHPDDDVISMGGTLLRLVDQGHEVHVAYQTSGNIAVFDDEAIRFTRFVMDFNKAFKLNDTQTEVLYEGIHSFLEKKEPGQVDSLQIQLIKGLIRRSEAESACRYSGIKEENIHFMDLPFYETGTVRKKPIGEEDVALTVELLNKIKPHQIYAAGDLSDPHGTHRVCLNAIFQAVNRLQVESWMNDCRVWLYRGAWQEWELDKIEMAVPLSPQELVKKKRAIFKHQSQKDRPLFPGADQREFWQRAEERNRSTADLYNKLGLPEYEAIEAFVEWKFRDKKK
ncbi:MAG TPA: glucosamine-6-phosphate deaminase [Cytophagaceae bacterium]|jgi:glucosamine-6-phosphate deaminase